ncbi:MAG: hypothetical protein JWQ12_665 [Glaciihabitans sp.]|nr:hypothetical protein [Glaciihabitans sp.]
MWSATRFYYLYIRVVFAVVPDDSMRMLTHLLFAVIRHFLGGHFF